VSGSLRALRWRAALAVGGAVVAWMTWVAIGGGTHIIQIEFGIDPETLVGAEVVVNGEVVGTLQRPRARTVNGFEVEPGVYSVELRLEGFGSSPHTVDTEAAGGRILLYVDFSDRLGADGESRTFLELY
jgi:hypothetical protein